MNKTILFLIILITALPLWSNPFLGSQEEPLPQNPRKTGKPLTILVDWQLELKEKMGSLFQIENGGPIAFFSLMGFSFLYGLLHAAGPGHRKTVIFSLFLGRRSRWWEPMSSGFFSAGLHGLSGLALMLILHGISRRMIGSRINKATIYLEGITYIILFLLSLLMIYMAVRHFKKGHHHGEHKTNRGLYSTLAVSSLFPCPGAIMILMFSLAVGQLLLGAWAILFLSLGMGVTVSFTAYLGYTGRKGLFAALKEREELVEKTGFTLELGAYAFLALYSAWAVLPFITSL